MKAVQLGDNLIRNLPNSFGKTTKNTHIPNKRQKFS